MADNLPTEIQIRASAELSLTHEHENASEILPEPSPEPKDGEGIERSGNDKGEDKSDECGTNSAELPQEEKQNSEVAPAPEVNPEDFLNDASNSDVQAGVIVEQDKIKEQVDTPAEEPAVTAKRVLFADEHANNKKIKVAEE